MMASHRAVRGVSSALLGACAALLAGGCASGTGLWEHRHATPGPGAGVPPEPGKPGLSVAEAIAEVDACSLPPGIPPGLALQLKQALAEALRARGASEIAQAPPRGSKNAVPNLEFIPASGGAADNLAWSFVSVGDYDQNGEVNVSDLTPLALNFGAAGPFAFNTARSIIDGDGNNLINLADVTAIGQNYKNTVVQWQVYASQDPGDYPTAPDAANGPGTRLLGTEPMSAGAGLPTERMKFSYEVPSALAGDHYWVRPSDGTTNGAASNLVDGLPPNWLHTFGGSVDEDANGVALDVNDRSFVAGTSHATPLDSDIVMLRCGPQGGLHLARIWGGAGLDQARAIEVHNDRVYIAGWTESFGPGPRNALLLCFDLDGNLQWSGPVAFGTAGATVEANDVAVDQNGDIWIVGSIMPAAGTKSVLIARFNSNGLLQWYDAWSIGQVDAFTSIYIPGPGNIIYVAGQSRNSTTGFIDLLLACYFPSGTFQWARTWSDAYSQGATDLVVSGAGNIYVTGYVDAESVNTTAKLLLLKCDLSGNVIWARSWFTDRETGATGIAMDAENHLYLSGYNKVTGNPNDGLVLLRYNTDGDLERRRLLPAWPAAGLGVLSLATDSIGRVIYTGLDTYAHQNWDETFNCTSLPVTTGTSASPIGLITSFVGTTATGIAVVLAPNYLKDVGGGGFDLLVGAASMR